MKFPSSNCPFPPTQSRFHPFPGPKPAALLSGPELGLLGGVLLGGVEAQMWGGRDADESTGGWLSPSPGRRSLLSPEAKRTVLNSIQVGTCDRRDLFWQTVYSNLRMLE